MMITNSTGNHFDDVRLHLPTKKNAGKVGKIKTARGTRGSLTTRKIRGMRGLYLNVCVSALLLILF